ncbi:hypothetical protein CJ671_00700 [Aliarcobacter cryaerophilus]|uniref:Calx-beta domain-containing protein n=1 Tax=Aliarcobacter cryaerophilus TaxID=28198 RepID=A0A2S9SWI7_9BACT|nr:Calx-beta domain-containing protein [Aliarcobacter cryaerophilus]PRM90889.1 hypothetical protein CJ671_00700 [Aliarcobacter cryaerophilus]
MSAKVGIVQEINDGNFFVKDSSGNTKELKNGDIIYENDVVFSDGSNSSLAQIKIALEGEDIIVLKNGVQQLFDSSLIASTFGNEEMVFAKESIDAMLDSHSDMTNVWSNLNEEGFSDYQDITEEETTAGEEEEEVLEEGSIGQFALRDGALVDVISDLRKKSWVRTQDYREVENSEALEEASLKPLGGIDSITTVTPPSTIPVTPPPVTPPTVTPPPPTPVPIANLSIDDITMYEQDGYMVFTVTLDRPANGNISVNFATSNGTAESGKDYTPTTGVITIPSGSSTAQIRVPINDDYYYENSEQFKVTLTNPTGNVNMVKPVGIGTILDNPPTTEKTPTTNNTPDSGTGTYDSGDTVYVKLVNSATTIEDMTKESSKIEIDGVKNDGILEHFLQLVDKNGNYVEIPDGKSITVTLEYSSLQGTIDDSDFDNTRTVEITLTKNDLVVNHDGTLSYKITNHAIMDSIKEDLESYNLKITDIKQNGDAFENVIIHKDFNTVTGTIIDVTPIVEAIVTPEDTSKTIELTDKTKNISKILVDNGKGFVEVAPNGKVDLYDNGKVVGTITYDENGRKFTFTPNEDYSNYKNADDIKFMYFAEFADKSNEFKQVKVQVTPVADAPTVSVNNVTTYEDNKNTQEGQHKIALGLIVPSLSKDQTDKNGADGDHPERNGEITLTFTNGDKVTGAKLFNGNIEVATINSNNQEIKVVIVTQSGTKDVDYTYHHKDITASNPSGAIYLTKTEYESLKIQHAEDNDTDISINIGVTSYELDDNDEPLTGNADYSKTTTEGMTVVILPVTDNISIKWDNINSSGNIDSSKGEISNNGKTYTFKSVDKKEYTIISDINEILSATSGALNGTGGTKGDLDGTEKRIYEITGLPKDTVVTLDNKTFEVKEGTFGNYSVTKDVNGVYTISIPFPDNTKLDPNFEIKLPKFHQGTVEGKITLKVIDEGATGENQKDQNDYGVKDKNGNPLLGVKEDSVNFKININPVVISDLSNETIQIAQAIGNEDAGRGSKDGETNNVHNKDGKAVSSSGNITNPENGLKLNIEPKGSNLGAKGETATIWIDKVPVGGSLYVYDNSTKTSKLIGVEDGKVYEYTKDSNNEYTVKTELLSGKSGNISVTLNADSPATYKVEILDYQNSNKPNFIPPHNDDKDYTFQISGEKVSTAIIDGVVTTSKTQYTGGTNGVFDMVVIVKNIADEPINTELVDSSDKIVTIGGNTYIKATEDEIFYLKDIYKNGIPNSFDNVGAEVLSIKITLPAGVTIQNGTKYKIDGNEYVIKSTDLDNIKLQFPTNFSGTTGDIKLTYITTETSGENSSKTHFTQTVNIFVAPVADDVNVASSSTIYEDVDGGTNKINITPSLKDTDGSETITSVKILASSVGTGFKLYSDASMTTELTTTDVSGTNYYVLTQTQWENGIYAKNTILNDADSSDNFNLTVVYTLKDTATGTADVTADFTHTHTVNVQAVTDAPDIQVTQTTTTTANVVITDNGKTITVSDDKQEFTVKVNTTSSDTDSSETVQRIEIHGVPKGVTIDGASYKGHTGTDSGVWVIYSPTDSSLDGDGAFTNIKFTIQEGSDFTGRDITIKTFTKDVGASEKTDFINIRLNDFRPESGTGPGTDTTPNFELTAKTPIVSEDTKLTLDDFYSVASTTGEVSGSSWATTITGLPDGAKLEAINGATIFTYEQSGQIYYVISGSGQQASDIQNVFKNIEITPPKDVNTGGHFNGTMTISGTISSTNGAASHQGATVDQNLNILPVTDAMTVAVTADSINEDGTSNLSITLSNPSDGSKAVLVGSSLTIKVSETWADTLSDGKDGTKGTLTQSGTVYNISESPSGTYTITKTDGTDFKVDEAITGLQYTPAEDRNGSVSFEVSVKNKETGSTLELDSKGTASITVSPIIDVVLNASVVTAIGTEDVVRETLGNPVKLEITAGTFTDGSEKIGNIILDEVPNGFTVWYKVGSDLVMATNIGTTGGGNFNINPNITPTDNTDNLVTRNKWLIPASSDGSMPEVYINAPTNWSGDFDFKAKFSVSEQNLSTATTTTVDVTGKITPVADGVTIAPTQVNGSVFSWVALQLNANMKDIDGSEVMNLELTGLSESSQFRIKDGAVLNGTQAVWDVTNSKWTITGIKYDEINKIQFTNDKDVTSVGVNAWTQEIKADGSNVTDSTKPASDHVTKDFKLDVKDVSGNFKFDAGLSLNFDNIGDIKTDGTYNIGLKNITSIDLGAGNGKNELLNLTLEDILDMGKKGDDGKINLEILGGGDGTTKDKVTFTGTGWSKETGTGLDEGFYVYSNSGDSSVKVKVQENISDGITN